MRIITEKKKIKIGKLLGAIQFIAQRSMCESDKKILFENMAKIIDDVAEAAFEIGGERFATIEVPCAVYWLQNNLENEEKNE